MYAPRIGGAERYLRDLLGALDAARFELHLLHLPWPAFDAYVAPLAGHVSLHPVAVAEPGASRQPGGGEEGFGAEVSPSTARRVIGRVPELRRVTTAAREAMRPAYVAVDRGRIAKALRAVRPELVHVVNGGYPGAVSAQAAAIAAAGATGRQAVMTVASTATPRPRFAAPDAWVDERVAAAVGDVIVPGGPPADALVARGFARERMTLIPWGIDAPAPSPRRREIGRARLDLEQRRLAVGSLANFTPTKGHAAVLDAYGAVLADAKVELVLGGDGPLRHELRARARSLQKGRVHFPGNIDDAFEFMAALDVFVLASEIEGLPYVVIEAMSQGVPVVATDVGSIAEAVVDGETGIVVPPRDQGALEDALRRLASDPELRARMGERARARFEERFSLGAMVDAHVAVYDAALAR
jgi:glycosyltransferase involved in cell wall biosynthesis